MPELKAIITTVVVARDQTAEKGILRVCVSPLEVTVKECLATIWFKCVSKLPGTPGPS